MIFTARSLLVSLAFFATVYCPLSLLVVLVWRGAKNIGLATAANTANLLFGLRIFPFAVSTMVTVFFTFPSFWLLERKSPDEDTGTFLLALCSLLILGAGLFRVLRVQARTTRAVAQWLMGATLRKQRRDSPQLTQLMLEFSNPFRALWILFMSHHIQRHLEHRIKTSPALNRFPRRLPRLSTTRPIINQRTGHFLL